MMPDRRQKIAERVSIILGPVPMGVLLGVAVGVHSGRGLSAGAGWGLLSVVCAAVLPAAATVPLRRREDGTPRARLAYMIPALTGAVVGVALLWSLSAPENVRVLAAGFAAGLLSSAALNLFYSSSNHVAALAGGTLLASVLLTPLASTGAVLVAILAWSRVALGAHTWAQTASGALVGASAASAAVVALLG